MKAGRWVSGKAHEGADAFKNTKFGSSVVNKVRTAGANTLATLSGLADGADKNLDMFGGWKKRFGDAKEAGKKNLDDQLVILSDNDAKSKKDAKSERVSSVMSGTISNMTKEGFIETMNEVRKLSLAQNDEVKTAAISSVKATIDTIEAKKHLLTEDGVSEYKDLNEKKKEDWTNYAVELSNKGVYLGDDKNEFGKVLFNKFKIVRLRIY